MQTVGLNEMKEREQNLVNQLSVPIEVKITNLLQKMQEEHKQLLQSQLVALKKEYDGSCSVPSQVTVTLSHSDAMSQQGDDQESFVTAHDLGDGTHEIVMSSNELEESTPEIVLTSDHIEDSRNVLASNVHEVVMSSENLDGTIASEDKNKSPRRSIRTYAKTKRKSESLSDSESPINQKRKK